MTAHATAAANPPPNASNPAALAVAAGLGAASSGALAVGAAGVPDEAQYRIALTLATYESSRRQVYAREVLQAESLRSMRRWEASGRPVGPGGVMPVFARYAYEEPLPAMLRVEGGGT